MIFILNSKVPEDENKRERKDEKFEDQEERIGRQEKKNAEQDLKISRQSETISKLEKALAEQKKTIEDQNETIQTIATYPALRDLLDALRRRLRASANAVVIGIVVSGGAAMAPVDLKTAKLARPDAVAMLVFRDDVDILPCYAPGDVWHSESG